MRVTFHLYCSPVVMPAHASTRQLMPPMYRPPKSASELFSMSIHPGDVSLPIVTVVGCVPANLDNSLGYSTRVNFCRGLCDLLVGEDSCFSSELPIDGSSYDIQVWIIGSVSVAVYG